MENYVPRLKKVYKEKIAPELFKELGYTSVMQIPAVKKVVVSMGVGEALTNKKLLQLQISLRLPARKLLKQELRKVLQTSNFVKAMK